MFTGIIESTGSLMNVSVEGTNRVFEISCPFTRELSIGQSVAHDGVCLTVTALHDNAYTVTAIDETLKKTNLGEWKKNKKVNLERCVPANGRFDRHIVQGHVDTTVVCAEIIEQTGSHLFKFSFLTTEHSHLVVSKGSVCINGVSLTVVDTKNNGFSVAVIPHTFEATGFHQMKKGDSVNVEFDIIGKYVERMTNSR